MTATITINGRELEVSYGWSEPEPRSWTDPGQRGGPEIEKIWEDGEVAELSRDEEAAIAAELEVYHENRQP